MSINQAFISELDYEVISTRKLLSRIPADKFDWKPHEKSMAMGIQANHLADLFSWYKVTLEQDELDFAKGYEQPTATNAEELVAILDKNFAEANESLRNAEPSIFTENWTLRSGEHVIFTMPRAAVLRTFVGNHIVHHRAQLAVYLRLNDIPLPSMYGPSADEK
jgi:uncharacterized damage-inducible protein DinB